MYEKNKRKEHFHMYDVCILGGGAAGMAMAVDISTANPELSLVIIEKKGDMGLKLKATGNGRCNISNTECQTFGETVKFFRRVGVEIKSNSDGWAYPVSEQGEEVVEALKDRIAANNVSVFTDCIVNEISGEKDNFTVSCVNGKTFNAKRVVMAMGGKAAPSFGTTGDGYVLARKLGHKVTKLAPCLVPVMCENSLMGVNKGLRAKAQVTLFRHGEFVEKETGEIQFTEEGLSGICIFSLSKYIVLNDRTTFDDYKIRVDFLPQYQNLEIFIILKERCRINGMRTEKLLSSIVKDRAGVKLMKKWSDKKEYAKDLTDDEIKEIILSSKSVIYDVKGAGGWKEAQCTTGGVSWDDFNWETMESKVIPGIYFAGEIIDYSGPCGGYNLENAWVTGRKASRAICTEFTR